jgi:hypothetical protein
MIARWTLSACGMHSGGWMCGLKRRGWVRYFFVDAWGRLLGRLCLGSRFSSSASLSLTLPDAVLCDRRNFRLRFRICRNDWLFIMAWPARLSLHLGMRARATPHLSTFPQVTKSPTPPSHIKVLSMLACGESEKRSRLMNPMESRCSSVGSKLVVVR